MNSNKNPNNLSELEKELDLLERKKKHLYEQEINKNKSSERKKRANRLIQTGALAEKYFDIHNLNIEQREEVFKMFSTFVRKNMPSYLKKPTQNE